MTRLTDSLKRHSLAAGIILMFLFTWPIDLASAGFLPFQFPFVVYILVGHGFGLASILMTWITLGREAVVALLKRFLIWRVWWGWYLVALLLLPALQVASVLLNSVLNGSAVDFSTIMAYDIFSPSAVLPLLIAPWFLFEVLSNGEEIGWRGYILPRLQARYNALVASLLVGPVWAFWHLPKFLGSDVWAERSIGWLVVSDLALAVLFTWLYTNTRGSLLLVTLFHASGNTGGMFLPVSFAVAGGVRANTQVLLYVLAAAVVIGMTGTQLLSQTKSRQVQGEEEPSDQWRIQTAGNTWRAK